MAGPPAEGPVGPFERPEGTGSAEHQTGGEPPRPGDEPTGAAVALAYDRAVDLGVLDRVEAELAGLEAALERLDAGTYGTCEVCGDPMGDDRLTAFPLTRWCSAHAPPDVVDPSTGASPQPEERSYHPFGV